MRDDPMNCSLRDADGARGTGVRRWEIAPTRFVCAPRACSAGGGSGTCSAKSGNGGILNAEPSASSVIVGMLVEGLDPEDFARLDRQESTHLPRETVYAELLGATP